MISSVELILPPLPHPPTTHTHTHTLFPQTESILNNRMAEELNTTLSISVYDVMRNETARKHRRELERKLAEEEQVRKEKEKDYLAPFLARIGDPPELDKDQMVEVAQVRLLPSNSSF